MKEIKKYISFPLKGIGLWEVLLVNALGLKEKIFVPVEECCGPGDSGCKWNTVIQ